MYIVFEGTEGQLRRKYIKSIDTTTVKRPAKKQVAQHQLGITGIADY